MPTWPLLADAWALRDDHAAAHALYTVLALRADRPLLTSDRRLAPAAAGAGAAVRVV